MPAMTPAAPLPASLAAIAADYWEAYLAASPMMATAIGDHRYDHLLPEPTPEADAANRARLTVLADRVAALDEAAEAETRTGAGAWDAQARITRSALAESITGDIAAIDAELTDWHLDPLDGVPTALVDLPAYTRLETAADAEAMVARWRAMGPFADAYGRSLLGGLREGRVAPRATLDRGLALMDRLLATPDADWPLLAPIEDARAHVDAGTWSAAEHERFARDLSAAVATDIRPAFERLRATLADELLPKARDNDHPGMGHVEGGQDGYRRLIRVHTSLGLAPQELHDLGLAEIERIDREILDLSGRVFGARSLADALHGLRTNPALYFSTREEIEAAARAGLARAYEAIPAFFGRLPLAPCEVVRIGTHEEDDQTIAYYRQPAPDGSRPGQYYVNTGHPETRPRYEFEALTYHESVPGHHLQIAIGQEVPLAAEFRKHLGPTAFFEGWGLYTERLADEMGLYASDLDRIGVASYDAWRASRLVVDTGMHALGWTRQEAIDFMTAHTALAPNNIVNEVDRYIGMPGQALAYKTGQLEMLRLRSSARERLGSRFDIRAFHDTLLGNGALALATLREVVDGWVAERLPG